MHIVYVLTNDKLTHTGIHVSFTCSFTSVFDGIALKQADYLGIIFIMLIFLLSVIFIIYLLLKIE